MSSGTSTPDSCFLKASMVEPRSSPGRFRRAADKASQAPGAMESA